MTSVQYEQWSSSLANTVNSKGLSDITALLQELHEGFLELRAGLKVDVEVVPRDNPTHKPATVGFFLRAIYNDCVREWDRFITTADLKRTHGSLHPIVSEAFQTQTGRALIARLLQDGVAPNQLADRLGEMLYPMRLWQTKLIFNNDPLHLDTNEYLIRERPRDFFKLGDTVSSLEVEVYQCWNFNDYTGTTIWFQSRESDSQHFLERNIDEAKIYAKGSISWGGHLDLYFTEKDFHFYSKKHARNFGALTEGIYQLAAEIMPEYASTLV
jgi:hypothetical protein